MNGNYKKIKLCLNTFKATIQPTNTENYFNLAFQTRPTST